MLCRLPAGKTVASMKRSQIPQYLLMRYTIIIPTYNRLGLLKESLDSVARQSFMDYEVIVVDDGSTDGTAKWVASERPHVNLLIQKNRGPGAARNLAAQHAHGQYLAFLDSDDLWFPWTLELYNRALSSYSEIALVSGKSVLFETGKDANRALEAEPEMNTSKCLFEALRNGDVSLPTPGIVVRADEFNRLGGFRPQYVGEDSDLWLRLGNSLGFVRILSPPVCAERVHSNRTTQNFERTVQGVFFRLDQELKGSYPGGEKWRKVRSSQICKSARPVSISCLHIGRWSDAWALYVRTLRMNVALCRFRYIVGFPFLLIARIIWSFLCADNSIAINEEATQER